jgi:GT2 family glycosyltransferase
MNVAVDYASANDAEEKEVGLARICICQAALKSNARFVWFVDDDVLPPNYAVQRLMQALKRDPKAMVCAGIYYSKQVVPEPLVFEDAASGAFTDWKAGQVFEVPGFIGTGCMLIKTEVFKYLDQPWFKTVDWPEKITDDAYFCRKVKRAGFRILGHGGVLCGHYNSQTRKVVWPPEEGPLVLSSPVASQA